MLILVVTGYAILIIYDFVPLYKEEKWADFWVNTVLCAISFIAAILLSLDVKLPSPEAPIRQIITFIFGK